MFRLRFLGIGPNPEPTKLCLNQIDVRQTSAPAHFRSAQRLILSKFDVGKKQICPVLEYMNCPVAIFFLGGQIAMG